MRYFLLVYHLQVSLLRTVEISIITIVLVIFWTNLPLLEVRDALHEATCLEVFLGFNSHGKILASRIDEHSNKSIRMVDTGALFDFLSVNKNVEGAAQITLKVEFVPNFLFRKLYRKRNRPVILWKSRSVSRRHFEL